MVKNKIYIGDVWFEVEDKYYENIKAKLDSVLVLASLLDYIVEAKHYHSVDSVYVYFMKTNEIFTLVFKVDKNRSYVIRSIHLDDQDGLSINFDYVWNPEYKTLNKLELLLN